jgi:HEAT repeat protein
MLAGLSSENYDTRTQSRNELLEEFSAATVPDVSGERVESMLSSVYPLLGSDLPLESRLYLIWMVELFGSAGAPEKLYPLLGDAAPEVRDSARRALAALKDESANAFLMNGLLRAPDDQRIAFIQALSYSEYAPAAAEIAKLLESPDSDVQAAAARGLALLGQEASRSALYSARGKVAPKNKVIVDSALLKIGVNAPVAEKLIQTGSSSGIRVNAFKALIDLDPKAAADLLKAVIADTEFPARVGMFALAMRSPTPDLREVLVGAIPSLTIADQIVLVAAISDSRASQYEPILLELLSTDSEPLRMAVIDALGWVGGNDSFAVMYEMVVEKPDNDLIADALSRLNAPLADKSLVTAVKNAEDSDSAIAALQIIAMRNSPGGTALVNSIARSSTDDALVSASFLAMEKIGDMESIKVLVDAVVAGGPNQRSAQRSLKRHSLNFGDPDLQWATVFEPALENATTSQKEGLIQILDSVACDGSIKFLEANANEPELRSSIIKTLQRWTTYEVASVWVNIASADGATEKDVSTAAKGLERTFSSNSMTGTFDDKAEAAAVAIRQTSIPELKKAVLAPFQEDIRPRQMNKLKEVFKPLTSDPDVGDAITELIK